VTLRSAQIVIIGAGAAGIGAGLILRRAKVPFEILESKQRVGGRAFTDTSSPGHLWDQGCHWFHSADVNVLRDMAEKIGHGFLRRPRGESARFFTRDGWSDNGSRDRAWAELRKIADAGRSGRDVSGSEVLDRNDPLYPLTRLWCQLMYAADPEQTSTLDVANYSDSGTNLAVKDGYGALMAKLAEGLPIKTGVRAHALDVFADRVDIETGSGRAEADHCILAVPVSQLSNLLFTPKLPSSLEAAIAGVPLGHAEKIAFYVDGLVFDQSLGSSLDIQVDDRCMSFELHPHGRPIVIGHVGGSVARDLTAAGHNAFAGYALEFLAAAFGSGVRRRIAGSVSTAWGLDPDIGGAYSAALPGQASLRREFLIPVHDRIHLAGEHVHQHYMATCHGAFETGMDAARRVLAALGVDVPDAAATALVG
jgi:monoamine oxidase